MDRIENSNITATPGKETPQALRYCMNILFSFILIVGGTKVFSQVVVTSSDSVGCSTPCTTLTANVTGYVSTISEVIVDDQYSGVIPIGFTFNYYGTNYTQLVVGANGTIDFNISDAFGYDQWSISSVLLGNPSKYNNICGPWCDIDVALGGSITYAIGGIAPNREFVVNYCSVPMYDTIYCPGQYMTSQIILHETTNIIEVHIAHKTICASWNSGYAIIGVQNASGSASTVAPGRDCPALFNCVDEAWRFTPSGGGTSYTVAAIPFAPIPLISSAIYWYNATTGAYLSSGSAKYVCPTTTTTYKAGALGCADTSFGYYTVIPAGPMPAITGIMYVCTGSTTSLSNVATGGIWSSGTSAIATIGSGSGVVTGVTAGTAIITYSLGGGCFKTATVTVYPLPSAITGATQVCSGASITLSDLPTGRTWSSSNSNVATVSPGTGVVTGYIAGMATITYTTGPGCIATASVTVNPAPALILGATGVCAGSTIILSDAVIGGTWSSSNTAAATIITAGAGSGMVTGIAAGTTIITYSLPAGCFRTATVTVKPLPDVITGIMHACTGLTTTLSDATGGGVWSCGISAIATVGSVSGMVTGVAAGVAVISYTQNGCNITTTVTINIEPSFNPGTPNICTDGTATLVATPGGGTWSSTNTTIATITSVSTDSAIVYGIDTGITIVTYSLSGCTTSRTITAVAILPPITGGPDVCTGQSILLSNAITGGTWSSGNTTIAIADAGTGTVTGVSPGVPVIIYSLGGSCVITTTITVNLSPDHGAITGPTNLCVGYTISLSDTVSSGVWGMSNGSAAITGTLVTGVSPGTDTVMYIVSNTLCTDTATKAITVYAVPDSGIISGLHVLCTGLTIILSDTASGGVWSSAVASIATVTPIAIGRGMVTGVSAGMDTIKYTVSNPGCATTASHVITVYDIPVPGIINGPAAVCIGTVFTLSDTASGGVWSSSNTLVATIDNNTDSLYTLNQGTTTIAYTIGPNPGGCIGVATFTLTVSVPLLVTVNSTVTDVTCNGDKNGSIKIGIDLSNIVVFYSWSNSDTGSLITGLDTGKYVLTITYGGTPCKSTDTFRITQPDSLLVTPVVENDICNEGRGSISLEVTGGTPSYSYLWSNNALGKAISGLAAEVYSVSVTDRNNCINILSVIVSDTCSAIMVHDVITPNGDGVNDIWVVEGIQNYLANTVQVFDKWGDLVYEKTNYSNDWDGKGKSGLLPDGTYYYLIKLNAKNGVGGKDTFTGTVLIKR